MPVCELVILKAAGEGKRAKRTGVAAFTDSSVACALRMVATSSSCGCVQSRRHAACG